MERAKQVEDVKRERNFCAVELPKGPTLRRIYSSESGSFVRAKVARMAVVSNPR